MCRFEMLEKGPAAALLGLIDRKTQDEPPAVNNVFWLQHSSEECQSFPHAAKNTQMTHHRA